MKTEEQNNSMFYSESLKVGFYPQPITTWEAPNFFYGLRLGVYWLLTPVMLPIAGLIKKKISFY